MIKTPVKLILVCMVMCTGLWFNAGAHHLKKANTDTTKTRTDANGKIYPTPPPNAMRLFYLQRSPNVNALVYDINIDKDTGKPDEDTPVHVYWLRYAEGHGEPSELTYIQRKFAYGVSSDALGNDRYDIRIMSYKKFPLTLMKAADGKYHIFATISKKQMILQNIFIQIEGGSLWAPNIIFVEMKGTDTVTGKVVTERFKP
ncbi:DUF4833 domain-containing protein [Mucilaginibacter phyllosphaerae]|uniref:DUF4833 domain-containing protein n=1 Tax=Mucilaginibacter phyllosphaerae TaxID=1812349 RepID=A0A4Y8AIE5_9SPHI|nr:DUF4833 domain-containing protein [Mucilaginibacter phyllosphaerae]MBB3968141.1 hypothetical protein [Mucilaginibacter phyllosphaerae]TEW68843.1 DUF4833 domain-containing protein [Mucilaginibacter phyllosphaerae]GGH00976.1 hypothetical protein GCM10007352_02490 [Mucilaginibacter phyllosphaerae]